MEDKNGVGKAILVGIAERGSDVAECERSLDELERLLDTAGGTAHSRVIQVKESFDPLQVNETYLSFLREGGYTIEGAEELCESLRKKGYTLYIITNGIALTQANRLRKSGLLPYIEEVFVSETIGYQKPKRKYFDYVLKNITEKDTSKVIVIGDSLSSDIKGAIDSELDYIWYNHKKTDIPKELNAVAVVEDIKEIDTIL